VERVSDEVLRSAVTYIHRSRKGDFDSATFTAAQTVLSPAFKCSASQDPFNFEISFRSLIDNYELINPGNPNKTDICLATLTPSSQSWVCISELVAERDLNPITNTTETRSKGRGTGWFKSCKDVNGEQLVFAFAHIPKQASVSNGSQNLWYLYQIIIVLCIVGGLVIILTICWCTARAGRYRQKMKEVQAQNEKVDDQIADMKMYGGGLGNAGKNEEINMIANPMVVKFKGLQDQLQEYKEKTGYYQNEAKRQNTVISRLEDQRGALNTAIKQLKTQLEEQRHRVTEQKKLREQQAAAAQMINDQVISAERSPHSGDRVSVVSGVDPIDDPDDEDEDDDDLGREAI